MFGFTGDDVLAFFLIKVAAPLIARLSDSVAPEVKTIYADQRRPDRQSDYGRYLQLLSLPAETVRTGGRVTKGSVHRINCIIFSATRGSTGVVAE